MADLKDVLAYLWRFYPDREGLSKARLEFMVYLADWKAAIDLGRQLTQATWIVNDAFLSSPELEEVLPDDFTGSAKPPGALGRHLDLLQGFEDITDSGITPDEQEILDHSIHTVSERSYFDLVRLVSSTYPILARSKDGPMDLVRLAADYRKQRPLIAPALYGT